MAALFQQYSFIIYDDQGINELATVHPLNSSVKLRWRRLNKTNIYVKECATDFVFRKPDFDFFEDIINDADCSKYVAKIFVQCDGNSELFFDGVFTYTDVVNFNKSKCQVTVNFRSNDITGCLNENFDKEYNLFELMSGYSPLTSKPHPGNIDLTSCLNLNTNDPSPADGCINPGEGWTLLQNDVTDIGGGQYNVETIWGRFEVNAFPYTGGTPIPPPGDGWILKQDNGTNADWWLPAATNFVGQTNLVTIPGTVTRTQWAVVGNLDIDNGYRLMEVIAELLDQDCGLALSSRLFDWNDDNTYPSNDAYDKGRSYFNRMVVWAISDVTNSQADENATIEKITLKGILDDLKEMFNDDLLYFIDGNTFYIEHPSYALTAPDIDVTTAPAYSGSAVWSLNRLSAPKMEKFKWPITTQNMEALPIVYGDCGKVNDNVEHSVKLFHTDFHYCQKVGENYPTLDGLFLAATFMQADSRRFIPGYNLFTNKFLLNMPFAFPNLHYYFWRWARYELAGEMNTQPETFFLQKKRRTHTPIKVKMCCSDIINFDPTSNIINAFTADGSITEAGYDTGTGIMELNFEI